MLTLDYILEAYSVKASGSTTKVHCFGAAHCSIQAEVDDEIRVEDEEESELKYDVIDL